MSQSLSVEQALINLPDTGDEDLALYTKSGPLLTRLAGNAHDEYAPKFADIIDRIRFAASAYPITFDKLPNVDPDEYHTEVGPFRAKVYAIDAVLTNLRKAATINCWYCGLPLRDSGPSQSTIDHIFPRGRGGKDHQANRVYACRSCNADKAQLTLNEYRAVMSFRTDSHFMFYGERPLEIGKPIPASEAVEALRPKGWVHD